MNLRENRNFGTQLGLGTMLFGAMVLLDQLAQLKTGMFLKLVTVVLVLLFIYFSEKYVHVKTITGLFIVGLLTFLLSAAGDYCKSLLHIGDAIPLYTQMGTGGYVHILFSQFDKTVLGVNGITAMMGEMYQYAVDPRKLTFHNSQYLYLAYGLLVGGLLNTISTKRGWTLWLLIPVIGSLGLWFLYFDVWLSFTCFFIGYSILRFSAKDKNYVFSWIVPLIVPVIALLLTAVTPIQKINEALQPYVVNESKIRTDLSYSRMSGEFSLDNFGYYPLKSKLGGPIKLDRQLKFRVVSDTPHLYLRGRVMKTYNGKMWLPLKEEFKNMPQFFAYGETVLGKTSKDVLNIEIKDIQFKTNVLLAPLGVMEKSVDSKFLRVNTGGIITSEYAISSIAKDGYTLKTNEHNQMMEAQLIDYLELPANYSPKVKEITEAVIKGAVTPEERMNRIRGFLIGHYKYSLSPKMPNNYKDFVEYFLTEEESGYCTYFATATAVMGRIAGVPTRYVEGFLTPKELLVGRAVPVTGERAHAWVEAWYGNRWHVVESTPAYIEELNPDDEAAKIPNVDVALPQINKNSHEKDDSEVKPSISNSTEQSNNVVSIVSLLAFVSVVYMILALGRKRFYNKGTLNVRAKRLASVHLELLGNHFGMNAFEVMTVREILSFADQRDSSFGHLGLVEFAEKSLYDSKGVNASQYEYALELHKKYSKERLSIIERSRLWFRLSWRGLQLDGDHR